MCGQGGVAGTAIMTSQQVYEGSTGKRSPQGMENGLQGSSTWSGEEERRNKSLEAENKELRARP